MIALGVAAVAAIVAWLLDRRRRKYADRATTPAAALFAGLNLVKGRAWTARALTSRRTGTASVWWEYTLEEERRHTRTVTDSKGRTRTETYTQWHTIETREDGLDEFEVVDDTGAAAVRLRDASVVPRQVHSEIFRSQEASGILGRILSAGSGATGRYRETENVVGYGDDLFVVGECVLDEERLVPVLSNKVMVSTRSEESHVRWLTIGVAVTVLVAMTAMAIGVATLVRPDAPTDPVAWVPGLVAGFVLLVIAWVITTYNRLRLVAQGAERAWSLVDVQLRRRHDLIPALSNCVAAHAAHEQRSVVGVTEARIASAEADPGDEAEALSDEAEAQTRALRTILAVAEDAPELTADQSFARLRRELADTEDRIAASRGFYNDSLTILRDRQQRFPGSLVASRVPVAHRDLIAARGFERTVPSVEHAFTAS
ncbi:MAG: LemA family protein [Acidimicrobiales bacterium]|nr:LemA family protein [Acidimicrobiales bacterium]